MSSMLYVARRLYVSDTDSFGSHVVNVVDGKCVSFFPFENEHQSMIVIDEIVLCNLDFSELTVAAVGEVLRNGILDESSNMYAYSLQECREYSHLRRLL